MILSNKGRNPFQLPYASNPETPLKVHEAGKVILMLYALVCMHSTTGATEPDTLT